MAQVPEVNAVPDACDFCNEFHAANDTVCMLKRCEIDRRKRRRQGASQASTSASTITNMPTQTPNPYLNAFSTPPQHFRPDQRLKFDHAPPRILHIGPGSWSQGLQCHCPECGRRFLKRVVIDSDQAYSINPPSDHIPAPNLPTAAEDAVTQAKVDENKAIHIMMKAITDGTLRADDALWTSGKTAEEILKDFAKFGVQAMSVMSSEKIQNAEAYLAMAKK